MENRLTDIYQTLAPNPIQVDSKIMYGEENPLKWDYTLYLKQREIEYTHNSSYLLVGRLPMDDGWQIHVSVVSQQMFGIVINVLDFLIESKVCFSLPADAIQHSNILDGRCGLMRIGKVITIYINKTDQAISIAETLIKLTEGFKGPAIPTAVTLDQCVYVSYGTLYPNTLLYDDKYYSSLHGFNAEKALWDRLKADRIKWPFNTISPLKKKQSYGLIHHQYLPIQILKRDAKGDVLKCIKLNQLYNMQWCVLKQGKRHQCFDDAGRDIRDRLLWQKQVQQLLEGKVPIAHIIDYFRTNDANYLVFEFIDGVPLIEKINSLYQGIMWKALKAEIKREVISYLLQVIEIIETFHQNGLVHRDLNVGNFLIKSNGTVIAIDLELCYNIIAEEPSPAYTLGTPGYISPQQLELAVPTIKDDIYGLGALFVKVLSGLSPNKLSTENPAQLLEDLCFFLDYQPVSVVIGNCLNSESIYRPDLQTIKHVFDVYDAILLTNSLRALDLRSTDNRLSTIKTTIQKAINGLAFTGMSGSNKEWLSKSDLGNLLANESLEYYWHPGFHSGTAGILSMLSLAKEQDFATDHLTNQIQLNFDYLKNASKNFSSIQPGLWHGAYGIAIMLRKLIDSDLIKDESLNHTPITQLLSIPTDEINIADGISGQGLCLINCLDLLQYPEIANHLGEIVTTLLHKQEKDGSWLQEKDEFQSKPVKMTGFAYGIAGITYFLLAYYSRFERPEVKMAIIKSLNWLIKQRKPGIGNLTWQINSKNPTIDPWLEYGFSGVALTFIKAYEVLKNPFYKEIATSALFNHPKYISSNYLTFSNGLTGLGEIYLEAFKIFKDNEWHERAYHIAELLIHTYKIDDDSSLYWLEGNYTRPSPDLMTGNSGIVQFLMHYNKPEKINLPLFNFSI
jgi:serine/threonine protein kinase